MVSKKQCVCLCVCGCALNSSHSERELLTDTCEKSNKHLCSTEKVGGFNKLSDYEFLIRNCYVGSVAYPGILFGGGFNKFS
jgi:hypothetical protein